MIGMMETSFSILKQEVHVKKIKNRDINEKDIRNDIQKNQNDTKQDDERNKLKIYK